MLTPGPPPPPAGLSGGAPRLAEGGRDVGAAGVAGAPAGRGLAAPRPGGALLPQAAADHQRLLQALLLLRPDAVQ